MAQVGLILSDEGRTITAVNDSTTTAITAGDPVYFTTNNDVLGATFASARGAYAYTDIKVKTVLGSNTGYLTPAGIALNDAGTAGDVQLTVALEGIFAHPTNADTEAGYLVQFDVATSQKVDVLAAATTSPNKIVVQNKVGRALTGGSADGKYIIWKLAL